VQLAAGQGLQEGRLGLGTETAGGQVADLGQKWVPGR
jgi:hypothetical protein